MQAGLTKKGLAAKGVVIFILVNVFLMFTYGGVLATSHFGSSIKQGIKVHGVMLGGLDQAEALRVLAPAYAGEADREVTFLLGKNKYIYSYRELGILADLAGSVQRAFDFGRTGTVQARYHEISLARSGKVDLPLLYSIDQAAILKKIDELAGLVDRAPRDAGFAVGKDGTFLIIDGQPGIKIDRQQLLAELSQANLSAPVSITLNPKSIVPQVSTSQIEGKAPTELISEAATTFDPSNLTRKENLRVAAEKINNRIFAPGEVVSFNEVVGPRVVERGFKEANVILNGKFVPGVGGGVCQVSSTLYYAVLKANLKVITRSNHSLKVAYLPAGLDAVISGNEIDFRFQNITPGYLMTKAEITGGKLTVQLFGVPEAKKYEVKVISKVIATISNKVVTVSDKDMPLGKQEVQQKGQPGYKAQVTRELWQDGKLVMSEIISNDKYKAQDRIVKVGAKPLLPADLNSAQDTTETTEAQRQTDE